MTITDEPDTTIGTIRQHPDITHPTPVDPEMIAEINEALDAATLTRKPSADEVIAAIIAKCTAAEVPCTERQARQIIGFMCFVAGLRRRAGYEELEHHLNDREIARFHPQMDAFMADDVRAVRGSGTPQDLLERHVLGAEAATRQLVHTKSKDIALGKDFARDCTVWVGVRPI